MKYQLLQNRFGALRGTLFILRCGMGIGVSRRGRDGRCSEKYCGKNCPTKRDAVCRECVHNRLHCLIHFSWAEKPVYIFQ